MKILALDLGKFNTMCCLLDSQTRKHSFLNATTERNYLETIFKKHKIDVVVTEAQDSMLCKAANNIGDRWHSRHRGS